MSPEFKSTATILLQARIDGKLSCASEFFELLMSNQIPDTVSIEELNSFIEELIPCDDLIEAVAVARKYDLISCTFYKSVL